MPRNLTSSAFMKPFIVLALPGMYLFYKYNQYKQQQQEQSKRKVTEKELAHLNHKIDKLLAKLEENEPEMATSQDDECVICVNAKATMQTSPCGHRVVCRKCFVKTIQMAVSQRLLPLRCVICRAKILRLKQGHGGLGYSKSWLMPSSASSYSMSAKSWSAGSSTKHCWTEKNWMPSSASQYSMTARNVPNSASMYSMASGSSSLSGMSSISSATKSSASSKSSSTASGARGPPLRQPLGSLKKSQQYSMKMRIQEYNEPRSNDDNEKPSRLAPIAEFQREYRLGKAKSSSTRIRCAQKIVTQLEACPVESEKNSRKLTTSSNAVTTSTTSFFKTRSGGKEDKKIDKDKVETRREKEKQLEDKEKTHDSGHNEKSKKPSLSLEKKKNEKEVLKEDGNKTEKKKQEKDTKTEKSEGSKELKETEGLKETNEKEKETLL